MTTGVYISEAEDVPRSTFTSKNRFSGTSRTAATVVRYAMLARNVNDAPCDEATRIGFFSLKAAKYDPAPRFRLVNERPMKPEHTAATVTSVVSLCARKA